MGKDADKYQRIEEAEGVKVDKNEPSSTQSQIKGKMHTVKSDETLSHIALKYYGSAAKDKWMIIYEANKEVIGDDPNKVRSGMELFIPEE